MSPETLSSNSIFCNQKTISFNRIVFFFAFRLDTSAFCGYVTDRMQDERKKKMKKNVSKFSLVEILAVVAIIGILAGIALGVTSYVRTRNREVQTETTIKMLEMVVEQYKNKYGAYPALNGKPTNNLNEEVFRLPATPSKTNDLVALFSDISYNGEEIVGIKGVNIAKVGNEIVFLDGWGSPIIYIYPGVFNKTSVDFVSAGADKKLGDGKTDSLDVKNGSMNIPSLGTRGNGIYKDYAGKGDDISNFKRTDN